MLCGYYPIDLNTHMELILRIKQNKKLIYQFSDIFTLKTDVVDERVFKYCGQCLLTIIYKI